ncbi:hypothetical protein B0J17DRAFT_666915, partial [Rhizoctonia solani]
MLRTVVLRIDVKYIRACDLRLPEVKCTRPGITCGLQIPEENKKLAAANCMSYDHQYWLDRSRLVFGRCGRGL